ncbi:unnamed protein product, partial [Polarella glacialis]
SWQLALATAQQGGDAFAEEPCETGVLELTSEELDQGLGDDAIAGLAETVRACGVVGISPGLSG